MRSSRAPVIGQLYIRAVLVQNPNGIKHFGHVMAGRFLESNRLPGDIGEDDVDAHLGPFSDGLSRTADGDREWRASVADRG
jgi:hypothetical protein